CEHPSWEKSEASRIVEAIIAGIPETGEDADWEIVRKDEEPTPPKPVETPRTTLDRDTAIKRIRAALKRRSGKTWSVTGDRGTAWGWINIDAPPKRRTWRDRQTRTPEPPEPGAWYAGAMGLTPPYRVAPGAEDRIERPEDDPWAREAIEQGESVLYLWEVNAPNEEFGHMSPDDQAELGRLLGQDQPAHFQGHSVSPDSRAYIVSQAEGN